MKRLVSFLPVILLLVACSYGDTVEMDVTRLTEEFFTPVDGEIQVFFDDEEPDFDYVRIARIDLSGNAHSTMPALLERMKTRARELGGDAIVDIERTFKNREQGVIGGYSEDYDAIVISGMVVRVTDGALPPGSRGG